MESIIASIVLYQPDMQRLEENIEAIKGQVKKIVLVINGPGSEEAIEKYSGLDEFCIIHNDKNKGIAYALNQAMQFGYDNGYEWVITLDQDSVVPKDIVAKLSRHFDKKRVGIVAPDILDRNVGRSEKRMEGWTDIKRCITSASITKTAVWKEVGGFTNELFIDFVDYDYCAKLIRSGYRIIKDFEVSLLHEVGHAKRLHFGKKHEILIYNHKAFRRYYYTRNAIYFYKTYPEIVDVRWEKRDLLVRSIVIVLFEKDRLKKAKAMIRGALDSRKFLRLMKKMQQERQR